MNSKQQFIQYLTEKKKKQSYIDECAGYVEHLNAAFDAQSITPEAISDFNNRTSSWSLVALKTSFQFLDDYAKFSDVEQPSLADAIRLGCRQIFEQTAKNEVKKRKRDVLPIPTNVTIAPKHLGKLSNDQFIAAFGALQQLVIACYYDIESDPFAWGYPDFYATGGYNRVNDILFAMVFCGECNDSVLAVNAVKFFAYTGVKRHKNLELMISGFEKMGFTFDSFDKKSGEFSVSYPNYPNIMTVLCAYVNEIGENEKQDWRYGTAKNSFSYRFIEDTSVQTHERVFLAKMDYASEALREIQIWLHAEAAKYGFTIDPDEWEEKGCMLYKKGSKRWLLVGQRDNGSVFAKAIFRDVHTNEHMATLYRKFPDTFRSNCGIACGTNVKPTCTMRIEFDVDGKTQRCCAYHSFIFINPTLGDVKMIMELFKLENKIK